MVSTKNIGPLILTGVTGSGKTSIAIELALNSTRPVQIINADSLLFYRHFDIGTAKPTPQEQKNIPHHLIDFLNPEQNYSAAHFIKEVHQKIRDIQDQGQFPLIVGGSGFYLKALLYGMWEAPPTDPVFRLSYQEVPTQKIYQELIEVDPDWAHKIQGSDRYRMIRALEIFKLSHKKPSELALTQKQNQMTKPWCDFWVIQRQPEDLKIRLRMRAQKMIQDGLIEETQKLLTQYGPLVKPLHSVGYKQVLAFLNKTPPQGRKIKAGTAGLLDEIELATRQLAKRQKTWIDGLNSSHVVKFTLDQDFESMKNKFLQKTLSSS